MTTSNSPVGPRNPIAYALFHARGGWTGHLLYFGIVAALLAGLMVLTVELSGTRRDETYAIWAMFLLFGQSATLGLAAMVGVSNAVRTDTNSGMLDSLRLSRTSPASVVGGYMLGGALVGVTIYLPCLAAGCVASAMSKVGAGPFLWASALLISTTVLTLSFVTFQALGGPKQGAVGIILSMAALPVSLVASARCPPLVLLAGPAAIGATGSLKGASVDPLLVVSLLSQLLVASIFFAGATRRYRAPREPALRRDLGMAICILWSILSVVGMVLWDRLRPSWVRDPVGYGHIIGSVAPAFFWALVAVVASAREAGLDHRDPFRAGAVGKPWRWWADVLVVAAIVCVPLVRGPGFFREDRRGDAYLAAAVTVVCCVAWLLSVASVARWAYGRGLRFAGLVVGAFAAMFLGVAPLSQWALWLVFPNADFDEVPHVLQFSPISAFSMAWVGAAEHAYWREVQWGAGAVVLVCLFAMAATRLGKPGQRELVPPPLPAPGT